MIVLVAGLPGSGKSFFAGKLAEVSGFYHISSDHTRINARLRGDYTIKARQIVYGLMLQKANAIIENHESVIVDATFSRKRFLTPFLTMARRKHVPFLLFEIHASESLVRERLKKTRSESDADFEVYQKIKEEVEPIHIPHIKLRSGKNNIRDMMEKAMGHIVPLVRAEQ